jgi:DNA-binding MarR family transcriptional regulator
MTVWHTTQVADLNEDMHGRGSRLPNLMRRSHLAVIEYVHRRLGEEGFDDVRPAHMTIFQNLDADGSRIGELAERSQLTNQSVGYLVDYLEQHGYVTRRPDPSNRRATLVCLTERGWAEMHACARILSDIELKVSRKLGLDHLAQLDTLLTDFSESVESLE